MRGLWLIITILLASSVRCGGDWSSCPLAGSDGKRSGAITRDKHLNRGQPHSGGTSSVEQGGGDSLGSVPTSDNGRDWYTRYTLDEE